MSDVVAQMETGRMRTTVLDLGDGRYEWIRNPGRDCPEPFGIPRTTQSFPRIAVPAAEIAFAELAPADGACYSVRGPKSLAELLIGRPDDRPSWCATVLRGVGELLAVLHSLGDPDQVDGHTPIGPRRLRAWLRDGSGPRAASRFHRVVADLAGQQRLDLLTEWCDESAARQSAVVLHGRPGSGLVIPASSPGPAHLLVGDELATGPSAVDLGYFAGELLELRHIVGQADPAYFEELIRALLDGYGEVDDLQAVGRFAATGIWNHLHDFSAYMGWNDDLQTNIPFLIDTLDTAADGELLNAFDDASRATA
ncbi:hypothetical protein [Kribbella catacumbae]|uniref:hypothetical protein n=1 Tax=Kribbella catacumbae TaxID=460086 RepID=UPI00036AA9DB|nr:hypothetical protein [Kribbella catacumbae]